MDVLIVSQYIDSICTGNDRFCYLADMLMREGNCEIEILTSDFNHTKKKHKDSRIEDTAYKVTYIHEFGYKRNISLKRIFSHSQLAKNAEKYFANRKKPDVIYCAVPSLNLAKCAANYAKRNQIKFIIDIQDLWPEAFMMVLNVPFLFKPLRRYADKVYSMADAIVAVSDTYLKRALKVNKKSTNSLCVFLGTDLKEFDKYAKPERDCSETVKIVYVGTLGSSYDLQKVMDALYMLKQDGIDYVQFLVMGDGPLYKTFYEYSKKLGIRAEFTGRLPYAEMVERLSQCDIAVNPIRHNAAQSIINKVGDYAAAALPVINTQECEEYRSMVEKYRIGYNCENGNARDIKEKIERLVLNSDIRKEFGKNNRKLAEELFDREQTYLTVTRLLHNICIKHRS